MLNRKTIGLVLGLILIDQLIKLAVVNYLTNSITIIPNFLSLNYLQNFGVSFSLLNGHVSLIIPLSIMLLIWIYKILQDSSLVIPVLIPAFIYAGGISNLIDRIFRGFVVDYIDVIILKYDFPVFNLADSLLCIGGILLLCCTIYQERIKNGKI